MSNSSIVLSTSHWLAKKLHLAPSLGDFSKETRSRIWKLLCILCCKKEKILYVLTLQNSIGCISMGAVICKKQIACRLHLY